MAELFQFELGQVCSRLSSGKGIPAKKVHETGKYPVFGGNGLRGYTDQSNFEGECAIIGRQGAFCGNVRYFHGAAYMTEHAVVLCANEENDTRYLAYLLSTMNLGRLSGQSAQPGLSVKTLAKQIVSLPSFSEQKVVADTLSALDEKIENNSKVNHHLASTSTTDNSPDIRRGRRVSRRFASVLDSFSLADILENNGIIKFSNEFMSSSGGNFTGIL